MKLQDQITEDLKNAMRNKDVDTLSTLRMLSSAIKNKQIALQTALSEDDIIGVIASQAKQRKDSIEQYKSAGREELAQKEEKELSILNNYLPTQMSEEEIKTIINDTIVKINAQGPQDMGKVMERLCHLQKAKQMEQ